MRALFHLTLLILTLTAPGCVYAPLDLGSLGEVGKPFEARLTDGDDEQKVVLLRIDGEITGRGEDGFLSSTPATTSQVRLVLDQARKDPDVRAVLLRINSPGGGVTASDVIHHELARFRAETNKPIVAWFGDTAASGGYYVAMAADHIVAAPTCVTGSIGVIATFPNVEGLGEKIGVKVEAITSGDFKDSGSMFRGMRPEERAYLQALIDGMYARFVDVVVAGRVSAGLSREDVLKLADGRVYTGSEALGHRLVDSVGYLEDALDAAAKAAGLSEPMLVAYERRSLGGDPSSVYSAPSARVARLLGADPALEALSKALPASGPTLLYRWRLGR